MSQCLRAAVVTGCRVNILRFFRLIWFSATGVATHVRVTLRKSGHYAELALEKAGLHARGHFSDN